MDRRMIVFLAAPPASGKSTLAAMLQHLSETEEGLLPVQALGIDGYHYAAAYLETHTVLRNGVLVPMKRVKGAPDTFDTASLGRALDGIRASDGMWNAYSRVTHDIVPNAIRVTAPIVLVEGNWLLLEREPWTKLPRDRTVFLRGDLSLLKDRLVARKIRGGLSPEEAEAFYRETDGPNVELCLAESGRADETIYL